MNRIKILVTGSDGQLGKTIQKASEDSSEKLEFVFRNRSELDITNFEEVKTLLNQVHFDYCINCAAYTNVDEAEKEHEKAFTINGDSVKNLAEACHKFNTILIHISTDFVFDGESTRPYLETDSPNPICVYGASKLEGEEHIIGLIDKYFIIRTSWLYSEFGNNFVKTMLRLSRTREEISVISDQIGTPTYALDLAKVIIKIILSESDAYGIYHYSNNGETTWYDFAREIFKSEDRIVKVIPVTTKNYPTLAVRPKYSVLSNEKITNTFNVEIPNWKESLKKRLTN
jgi:dTDP-4-dehydrorhamnose reductase